MRIPVSLLSSYVRQLGRKLKDESLKELTEKAVLQLGRIELTYDRVLAAYDEQKRSTSQPDRFDVTLALDHILSELPDIDRAAVELSPAIGASEVIADPYSVVFAFNSMLAYLVRSRTGTEPITIAVKESNGAVEVSMSGPVQHAAPVGRLAEVVEQTRTDIALGQDALNRIAADYGGHFKRTPQSNGRELLVWSMRTAP